MGWFGSPTARAEKEAALLALAAHELGHAIGCAAAGIAVRDVRLWSGRGQVRHADINTRDRRQVDGALVMTLAGWAAAAEWAHRHHGMPSSEARTWARAGARGDWAEFRRQRRHGSHPPGWYETAARRLVRSHWSRIERDAAELLRTGRIPGHRFT